MSDLQDEMQQAIAHHQAGNFPAAEAGYRRALKIDSTCWEARYLLGTALLQHGEFAESVAVLQQAVATRPEIPDAGNNLGVAYKALGEWDKAVRAFEAAIQADPDYDQALFNLGNLMEERKLYVDAEKCYRRVLELAPTDAKVRQRLHQVLIALERWADVESELQQALEQDPRNIDLLVQRGYILVKQARFEDAIDVYEQVLGLKPDFPEIHNNLSYIHERQGRLEEAVASARKAVEMRPDYAEGYNNLGIALKSHHEFEAACDCFEQALRHQPNFALAEFNLGTTRLLQGRFLEGWPGYERRAETLAEPLRPFEQPRWDGSRLEGGRLLVYSDQGLGDAVQFVRFLPQVREQSAADIIFECQPKLRSLFAHLPGVDELIVDGETLPSFDAQVPLASVPAILQTTIESLPACKQTLTASSDLSDDLQALLATVPSGHLKVGLAWQGNPLQARDNVRSCPLADFAPLADMEGITLVGLQTETTGLQQLDDLSWADRIVNVGPLLHDLATTAGVVEQLDLIITVDSAVGHLAGALGKPTWVLLCHTPDWRWLLDRDDTPWYASMRLFRQPSWGDWKSVVQRVVEELPSVRITH